MSRPENRFDQMRNLIEELLEYYIKDTKGETLAAQRGLLTGILARIAATDWELSKELEARIEREKQK
jgi:hypothetical protein